MTSPAPHPAPSSEPLDVHPCPSCRSVSTRRLYQRVYHGKVWSLARCRACGLHYTSPTPTDAELADFYAGDYHAELRQEGAAERAFGEKYRRYAEAISRHLPRGRVVDVGCSTGLLVRMLHDRGYDAQGVELNPASAAWGRQHYRVPIHNQPLERCGFAPGSLDAIILTDVLEHTRHPGQFLQGVSELLAPSGFVMVTFPDIRSVESRYQQTLAKLLRRDWLWDTCHVPLHVWEFTPQSAEACFCAAGFSIAEFRRSQPAASEPDSWMLRALRLPGVLPSRSGLAGWFGTQMEFVIQKTGDVSENRGEGRPRGPAARTGPPARPAAPKLRPVGAGEAQVF